MDVDPLKRRRRRGPDPLPELEKRVHCVSVRVTSAELAQLDVQRARVQMDRGEYLRAAALHKLPETIPALNATAWADLARSAANLNQIAHHLNSVGTVLEELPKIRAELAEFRKNLLEPKT
jgi:hypothetical protein